MKEYVSKIENLILSAKKPISAPFGDRISVNKQQGIWLNKEESVNWNGPIPLNKYPANEDPHPIVINKKSQETVDYEQRCSILYLKPPTPEPQEIIIREGPPIEPPPAPPLIIRQYGEKPKTPEPIILREAPPEPPKDMGKKIITIPGKTLNPLPRRVIVEKKEIPQKPPDIIIEKWLPYPKRKRRVIHELISMENKPECKNVVIEYEKQLVKIEPSVKDMGVFRTNPEEYAEKYEFENFERKNENSTIDLEYLKSIGLDKILSEAPKQKKQIKFRTSISEFFPKAAILSDLRKRSSKIYSNVQDDENTVYQLISNGFERFARNQCLVYEQNESPKCLKYSELEKEVIEIGSAFISLGLEPRKENKIGTYLTNIPETIILDLCCSMFTFISVPIDNKFSITQISHIIKQTELRVIAVDNCDKSIDLMQVKSDLKLIIIMDNKISKHAFDKANKLGIHLITYNRLNEIGQQSIKKPLPPVSTDVHSIVFKWENYQMPKGVVLSHSNIFNAVSLVEDILKERGLCLKFGKEVYLSCLPNTNILEKVNQLLMMNFGASIILHKGDFTKYTHTIAEFNPSIICLNQNFAQQFCKKIKEIANAEEIFGDETNFILVENFVSNPKDLDLLEDVCRCEILEISGETETCGLSTIRSKNNKYDFKKIFSSFKISGEQKIGIEGEILVKSDHIFKDYFNDIEETEKTFDEKGFYKTGDLGFLDENRRLKFIDKINQVDKNKDGHSISARLLESIYLNSNLITQIFVKSCETKQSLIAIVVPNETILRKLAENNNLVLDMERFCKNPIFKQIILNEINLISEDFKLQGHEKISDIYLECTKFSVDNKLLNFDSSLNRKELKNRFKFEIDQMFSLLN